jgi:acyl dehydratase
MALDMAAIGKKIGPLTNQYNWRDVIIYALGIGAGFNELNYVYEKNLQVIPTFGFATIFEFFHRVTIAANMNLSGILHSEQEMIFHETIPLSGVLTTEGMITDYYDKKEKGAIVVARSETFHSNGHKLFSGIFTIRGRYDGGCGGAAEQKKDFVFPTGKPDFIVEETPSINQTLLYRLSGDFFELHVDPEFALKSGFSMPIMHGLCTKGYACRALIASLIPGRPEALRRIACRFSRPLYPGEKINTCIWKMEEGKAVWRVLNVKTGETIISNGIFEYNTP